LKQLDYGIEGWWQGHVNFVDNVLLYGLRNGVCGNALPGIAIGASTVNAKTTNTVIYKAAGVLYSKAAGDVAFTAGAASNIAIGYETVFMMQIDKSGNILLIPGATALGAGNALYPELPADGYAVIGSVRVYTATNAWIAGTTALSATGVTVTYQDGYPFPLFTAAQ
jgi:hypothetical protein